jgi:hypothetical protein
LRRKGRAIEREQPSRFSGSFGANKKEGAERWAQRRRVLQRGNG